VSSQSDWVAKAGGRATQPDRRMSVGKRKVRLFQAALHGAANAPTPTSGINPPRKIKIFSLVLTFSRACGRGTRILMKRSLRKSSLAVATASILLTAGGVLIPASAAFAAPTQQSQAVSAASSGHEKRDGHKKSDSHKHKKRDGHKKSDSHKHKKRGSHDDYCRSGTGGDGTGGNGTGSNAPVCQAPGGTGTGGTGRGGRGSCGGRDGNGRNGTGTNGNGGGPCPDTPAPHAPPKDDTGSPSTPDAPAPQDPPKKDTGSPSTPEAPAPQAPPKEETGSASVPEPAPQAPADDIIVK
jgi:hypothetical protein